MPIRNERLWEMLESCRYGSDDLADPALEGLRTALATDADLRTAHGRLGAADVRLRAAMSDVPVPSRLKERVLGRLALESSPALPPDAPAPAARPARLARRWLLAAAGTAAAACVLAGVLLNLNRPAAYSHSRILEETVAWFASESPEPGRLQNPPEAFPFSRDVANLSGKRWRMVEGLLGRRAAAYDLPAAAGGRATLYVLRWEVPGLPCAPAAEQCFSTGNAAAVAWQDGGLLYVLVVDGGPRALERYLIAPAGPIA